MTLFIKLKLIYLNKTFKKDYKNVLNKKFEFVKLFKAVDLSRPLFDKSPLMDYIEVYYYKKLR